MLNIQTERIIGRLDQIVVELQNASNQNLDYYDRLREFFDYCRETPSLSQLLAQLPQVRYDFSLDRREIPDSWPGGIESLAKRWDAISQMVAGGAKAIISACIHLTSDARSTFTSGQEKISSVFVIPIANYLIDQLAGSGAILYILLRYKRWAEWFNADTLYELYKTAGENGEAVLDENLRRFLFESGVDYPFSQPVSPRGKVDVVAGLETDDPLVLEIKVWDSVKGYKGDRIRDGLRQVMDYADKYGKDKGHLLVYNLDQESLIFISDVARNEWPARIECGGKTFFFIDVNIAGKLKPISQQDKGKRVRVNEISLKDLLDSI
jgi:hypothetical protein